MELSTAAKSGILSLLVLLSGTGTFIYNADKTFYCKIEDNVRECNSLSSTNVTCRYFDKGVLRGDICVGGVWETINIYINNTNDINNDLTYNITSYIEENTLLKSYCKEPVQDLTKIKYVINETGLIRPILITGATIIKDGNGNCYVEGSCRTKSSQCN